MMPEVGRIDAAILDMGQGGFDGVDVMDGEQTGDVHFAGHGRNQARHPVMAMNEVRSDAGHDVVDHFPLESQGDLGILIAVVGVDPVEVEKGAIFGQMDAVIGHDPAQVCDAPFAERAPGGPGRWRGSRAGPHGHRPPD